jgi:hypothetical protein
MASPNVDKMIEALQQNGVLVAELHLVCARIEEEAQVDLTKDEKIEFFQEIARLAPLEPSITFAW